MRLRALLSCLCAAAHGGAGPSCPGSRAASEKFIKDFLAPISPKAFFREYWGKEPVVIAGHSLGRNYSRLFSADRLEDLVDVHSLAPERLQRGEPLLYMRHLRLSGRSLPEASEESVEAGLPEADASAQPLLGRLKGLLEDGWTVVLNKAYGFWKPVLDFVVALEQFFEVRVHGNIYITPEGHFGTPVHWDGTDVFFVQVSGRKRWRVWKPFVSDILDSDEAIHVANSKEDRQIWRAARELLLDETLLPGDILYIPRGFLHEGEVLPADGTAGPSVHLTVSPQVASWSHFLLETPLAGLARQPPPPGAGRFVPAGGLMPDGVFEQLVTGNGTPQTLRKFLPLHLSRRCPEQKFREMALQKLSALDPKVSRAEVAQQLSPYDKQIADMGRGSDVVADVCQSYAAVLLRGLISAEEDAAPDAELEVDRPMCVASPMAARVVPAWMSPPGFQKTEDEVLIIHSRVNGPVRRAQVAPTEREADLPSMPLRVPARLEAALAGVLHPERNPSGTFSPRRLLDEAPPDDRDALGAALRQLVERRVLEPSSAPLVERSEL